MRMRQYSAEKPGAEKARTASFCVTLGFSVRMAAMSVFRSRRQFLAEIDPQANHRGNQNARKRQVEQALRSSFFLEMWSTHFSSSGFLAHRRKRQSRDLFPLRCRIHHADTDQHSCADDEHQNGIVQKVHVHEPTEGAGIIMPGPIQHFEDKAQRTENKTRQERTDGPLSIQTRPKNTENEAHRNRRTDVRLYAL